MMAKYLPLLDLEDEYRRYLSEVRALRPLSIERLISEFRRFGRFLKEKQVRSAQRVSLDLAYEFLEERGSVHSRNSVGTLHGGVKSILRFLHFAGLLPEDITKGMLGPRTWALAGLPRAFSDDEYARMLAGLRAETPYDHRERAVMLLLICYGLRRAEVARLTLNDIDWRDKTVSIHERKSGVPLTLPLLPPVEEALRDYLTHFRPGNLKTRRLFVTIKRRSRAPLKPVAVHHIAKTFLRRCGIEGCITMFRHTLATRLVNGGASLLAVQGLLGHRSFNSTRIYAKVHWEALREVAQNYSLLL